MADNSPKVDVCTIANLRKTPLVITGIFLEILRNHFRYNSKQFKFSSDDPQTGIIISAAHQKNLEVVQKRPALYVKRGTVAYTRIAIDDIGRAIPPIAEHEHVVTVNGSVITFCVSKQQGEVERLADEVSEVYLAFKPIIRADFEFQRFDLGAVGEVGLLEESEEFYAVPISVNYQFAEAWVLNIEALKIKHILTDIVTTLTKTDHGPGYGDDEYSETPYG